MHIVDLAIKAVMASPKIAVFDNRDYTAHQDKWYAWTVDRGLVEVKATTVVVPVSTFHIRTWKTRNKKVVLDRETLRYVKTIYPK